MFGAVLAMGVCLVVGSACVVEQDAPSKTSGSGGTTSSGGQTSGGQTSGGGGCLAHTDCGSDEVCIDGGCNLAWGRAFRFEFITAKVPETNPANFESWDAFGGLPAPFGAAYLGDGAMLIHKTAAVQDTLEPTWFGEYVDVYLPNPGDELSFFLIDEDLNDDDPITGVKGPGLVPLG
jgi:hypothetical protein